MDFTITVDKTATWYLGIGIGVAVALGIIIGTLVSVVVSKRIA